MIIPSRLGSNRALSAATLVAVALAASACMPAPGPSFPPAPGVLEIGADYRSQALNRWVCPSDGSIVLAKKGERLVLHFENLDWVVNAEDAGDFVRFSFATVGGTLSVGWSTTKLNEGEMVYLASKTAGGDFVIKRASANGTVDEKCKVVAS